MAELRSPLREPPLRVPGQSVQEEIDRLLIDEMLVAGAITAFAISLPVYEWIRWFTKTSSSPWLISVLAVLAFVYALVRLICAKKRLDALKLGRDGE